MPYFDGTFFFVGGVVLSVAQGDMVDGWVLFFMFSFGYVIYV